MPDFWHSFLKRRSALSIGSSSSTRITLTNFPPLVGPSLPVKKYALEPWGAGGGLNPRGVRFGLWGQDEPAYLATGGRRCQGWGPPFFAILPPKRSSAACPKSPPLRARARNRN